MTLIADVFPKLRIPKNVVRYISKKSCFIGPFEKQHGKWDQTVLISEGHHFYHVYWSLGRKLSSNKSLLMILNISGLFFSGLSAGHKHSLLNRDNLRQPTHIQLSLKGKTFLSIFF